MSGEAGRGAIDLLWLVPALPLLGFVLNGVLALSRSSAKRVVSMIGFRRAPSDFRARRAGNPSRAAALPELANHAHRVPRAQSRRELLGERGEISEGRDVPRNAGSRPMRRTLTTTRRPSLRVAACTCAIVAAPSGTGSNQLNSCFSGRSSSRSTVACTAPKSIGGS